jgi:glycosyltransferase involved in cell wall biosynthesis
MRLLYVTPFIGGSGGVERVLSIKANYFIENWDYDVHILATNSLIHQKHYVYNEKINFHSEIASGKNFIYLRNFSLILKKYVNKINPDIIIVCDNGYKGYMIPFLISKKNKIIFECHGTIFNQETKFAFVDYFLNALKYIYFNVCASRFSKFVVLLDDFKKEFRTRNLVVISNPLWFSTNKFSNYSSKRVIAVGRHSYEKGFDRMLSIWQKVIKKNPEWVLEIYGESDSKIDLKLLSNILGISKNVKFFDPVNNIQEKYLEASFFVLSSRFEGFGMVLIEAMASGLSCISYDCPRGPRNIITNDKDGFLIADGNEDNFVFAVNSLIQNEQLRIELGKNAKISSGRFNLDKIMDQWKNLFQSLINSSK